MIPALSYNIFDTIDPLEDAISKAAQRGAKIVNISLGSEKAARWEGLRKAMAAHPKILFVIAAGNHKSDNDSKQIFPAEFAKTLPNAIVVASVNKAGKLSDFSNYGKKSVHLAAPGEDVLSPVPGGSYGKKSGTSMAAPFVSNVAGRVLLANPQLSPPRSRIF